MILCRGDGEATYKLSDISVECDAIFDKHYATVVCTVCYELSARTTSIPYTHVKSIQLPDTV